MNNVTDGKEEDVLSYEISDDELEKMTRAAAAGAGNYTFYFCTQLDLCPGP